METMPQRSSWGSARRPRRGPLGLGRCTGRNGKPLRAVHNVEVPPVPVRHTAHLVAATALSGKSTAFR